MRTQKILFAILISVFALNSVAQDTASKKQKSDSDTTDNPPRLGDIFKPTIGLGAGTLSYFGNIYAKGHQFQSITQSRIGYDLNLSQPLSKCLYLNFYVMFGKLGANERSPLLNQNFESQIRLGGVQLMYDFSNFLKKPNGIRPYILTGFEGFEFLSKTDLYDKHGNKYYYWSDGSIKNMAQGSVGSQNATTLVRDYTYDTDIREMNKNGYGKYRESSWALPIGAGFTMNAGEHIKFRMGATMHLTFTNHIDGVGSTKNDKFLMFNASVHYDLFTRKLGSDGGIDTLPRNHYDGIDYLAIDNGDEDGDGVKDFDDLCHGTPAGAKVDATGCPIDEDKDLTPDYKDEELPTDTGKVANDRGIAMTDEDFQTWYNNYFDSTGEFAKIVYVTSPEKEKNNNNVDPQKKSKEYTVELVRYHGGIPADEMAYLLSIGDVKSFNQGDTTIVYTAGTYEDVRRAIQRRDEYVGEGLKSARVGYFKGENYFSLSNAELDKEIDAANKKGALENTSTENNTALNDNAVKKGEAIYRVQLGAYKNKLSPSVFKKAGKVIELKTEDGYYRYASGSYKTIKDAASHRAELIYEGYEDAFITAYQNGKRVPLNKVGATFEDKNYKENLSETANTSGAVDKSLVVFKIQLALLKSEDSSLDDQLKELKDVDKQPTISGKIRITAGEFKDYNEAVKYKNSLLEKGFTGAFVIGSFKGEIISIQEALDLIK